MTPIHITSTMKVIRTVREMQQIAETLRIEGRRIALVPTMGYLHEGHLALVRKTKELADTVVVSIFVNPIQFGPKEDLSTYPRDFERDEGLLEQERTDIIFYPDVPEMYPDRYSTYVEVRELGNHLCGRRREGHFVGVTTVVAKLFNAVKPHFAIFGQKDYQQLKIIQRMVKDLNMDVKIIGFPTVREEGGLAMSSRNSYLGDTDRRKALLIHASMEKVREMFIAGEKSAAVLKNIARSMLEFEEGVDVEYVDVCDTETLEEVEKIGDSALLAVALRVGKTRLIDNTILES
jgi:pantoate--beta-alanine ligase